MVVAPDEESPGDTACGEGEAVYVMVPTTPDDEPEPGSV